MCNFIVPKQPQNVPQNVTGGGCKAAIFLVLSIKPGKEAADAVRDFVSNLADMEVSTGFRAPEANFSCVAGFSSNGWDRLFGQPKPRDLITLPEIKGAKHTSISTPGDILLHVRAQRTDLVFEFTMQVMNVLRDYVTVEDQTEGFRYFDDRDLLGFVDGTANPAPQMQRELTAVVGDWDPKFKGGSYVVTQKYLHDLKSWNTLPVEQQEMIIGRKKLSDEELADDVKPSYAHNNLNTVVVDGVQLNILRDNLPFGDIAKGEFGTYFIGYAAQPKVTIKMLENMFIGMPAGNYDRILDFSTPVTGTLFYCPTVDFLANAEPQENNATQTETIVPAGDEVVTAKTLGE